MFVFLYVFGTGSVLDSSTLNSLSDDVAFTFSARSVTGKETFSKNRHICATACNDLVK